MVTNYLRAILIRRMVVLGALATGSVSLLPGQASTPEVAAAARRVAATAQLAAEEYALGVSGGRIVAAPEVEEARLFLAEARRNATRLPSATAHSITALLTIAVVPRRPTPRALPPIPIR